MDNHSGRTLGRLLRGFLHNGPQSRKIERSYRDGTSSVCARTRKKGLGGALAQGFARASAAPQDTVSLMLAGVIDPVGSRAIGNLDVNLGRDVLAFASGEFASGNDWQAMAGLKMRF